MPTLPTISDFRKHGMTKLLVYCGDPCWHHSSIGIEGLGDDETVVTLSAKVKCSKCNRVGAEVRPDWDSGPKEKKQGGTAVGWIKPPELK